MIHNLVVNNKCPAYKSNISAKVLTLFRNIFDNLFWTNSKNGPVHILLILLFLLLNCYDLKMSYTKLNPPDIPRNVLERQTTCTSDISLTINELPRRVAGVRQINNLPARSFGLPISMNKSVSERLIALWFGCEPRRRSVELWSTCSGCIVIRCSFVGVNQRFLACWCAVPCRYVRYMPKRYLCEKIPASRALIGKKIDPVD